jgi:hypothetical protein
MKFMRSGNVIAAVIVALLPCQDKLLNYFYNWLYLWGGKH